MVRGPAGVGEQVAAWSRAVVPVVVRVVVRAVVRAVVRVVVRAVVRAVVEAGDLVLSLARAGCRHRRPHRRRPHR